MFIPVSKWQIYQLLEQDPVLSSHLPITSLFARHTLEIFLNHFSQIMIKPSNGSFGRGVIMLSALENGRFDIHNLASRETISGKENIYEYLEKLIGEDEYIIQQRIPLAVHHDRPFDLRVMVQRKKTSSPWSVTGKFAKVAIKDFMITNASSGPQQVDHVLAHSCLADWDQHLLLGSVDATVLRAAEQLETHFSFQKMLGFDIGLDSQGQAWIIEVNFKPVISPFRELKDASMFQKILLYRDGPKKKKPKKAI